MHHHVGRGNPARLLYQPYLPRLQLYYITVALCFVHQKLKCHIKPSVQCAINGFFHFQLFHCFFFSCCILTITSKCSIVSCCILTTLPVVILPFAPQLLYFHLLPQSCRTAPFSNLQRAVALALGPISKIVSLKMKMKMKTRMRKLVSKL